MIVGEIGGYAQGRDMVRDPVLEAKGENLAEALGRELAKIHSVRPPGQDLEFLTLPDQSPARVQVEQMRSSSLDTIVSEPRPALEYVQSPGLSETRRRQTDIVLCHGDFRTGNFMAENGNLTGILDWEFCHWGDRHDRYWLVLRPLLALSARTRARPAASARGRPFIAAIMRKAMKASINPGIIPYWEILAAARWAVVALLQGERHISGGEPSIELLLTGVMAPQMEHEALQGIMALENVSDERVRFPGAKAFVDVATDTFVDEVHAGAAGGQTLYRGDDRQRLSIARRRLLRLMIPRRLLLDVSEASGRLTILARCAFRSGELARCVPETTLRKALITLSRGGIGNHQSPVSGTAEGLTRSMTYDGPELVQRPANHVPLTPVSFLTRAAQFWTDKIAVIDNDRAFTYGEFHERCRRLAHAPFPIAASGAATRSRS